MSSTPFDRLLTVTDSGLYCPEGDFHIDPWRPVDRAVVTHAHADHASSGSRRYLASAEGQRVLQVRMGAEAVIDTLGWGESTEQRGVKITLFPAGHILGSAQVRLEWAGRVVVVSGDYKVEPDATCTPFEPVRCHLFLTESTFGLPIYHWRPQAEIFAEVNAWWRANRDAGRASLLFGYALGKSQRLLSGLDPTIGPIVTHGAVEPLNRAYRESGIALPPTSYVRDLPRGTDLNGVMVLAPPSAHGTPWARRFGAASTGTASGWMTIRGTRRRKALDRGFVLSDHADWDGLLKSIEATGAEQVWITHGYAAVLARYLADQGIEARTLATRFVGEQDESAAAGEQAITDEVSAGTLADEGGSQDSGGEGAP